jgi:hypothetical protein
MFKNHLFLSVFKLGFGVAIVGLSMPTQATIVFQTAAVASGTLGATSSFDSSPTAASARAEVFLTNPGYVYSDAKSDLNDYAVATIARAYDQNRQVSGSSKVENTWIITNTSGVASNFTSTFLIQGGGLSARQGVGPDLATATFGFNLFDITGTTNNLASNLTELKSNGNLTQSGFALNNVFQTYSWETHDVLWDASSFSINLGTLQSGETRKLRYEIFTSVVADYSNTPDGYCPTLDSDCRAPEVGAWGSDPGTFAGVPIGSFSSGSATDIPEPTSLLLFGASLGLLTSMRRRALQKCG